MQAQNCTFSCTNLTLTGKKILSIVGPWQDKPAKSPSPPGSSPHPLLWLSLWAISAWVRWTLVPVGQEECELSPEWKRKGKGQIKLFLHSLEHSVKKCSTNPKMFVVCVGRYLYHPYVVYLKWCVCLLPIHNFEVENASFLVFFFFFLWGFVFFIFSFSIHSKYFLGKHLLKLLNY